MTEFTLYCDIHGPIGNGTPENYEQKAREHRDTLGCLATIHVDAVAATALQEIIRKGLAWNQGTSQNGLQANK